MKNYYGTERVKMENRKKDGTQLKGASNTTQAQTYN